MTVVRSCVMAFTVGVLVLLGSGLGALAQGESAPPPATDGQLFQPLSPWAMAVFVWLVLFLAMAFIVAVAVLSRSRRY